MSKDDEAKTTRLVVLAFWSVVLIGLPFWWKTTEVYRAKLPVVEIEAWQAWRNRKFILPIDLTIHVPEHSEAGIWNGFAPAMEQQLTKLLDRHDSCAKFPISVSLEKETWKSDLDQLLENHKQSSTGTHHVYLNQMDSRSNGLEKRYNITVGNGRTSVIQLANLDQEDARNALQDFVKLIFHSEHELLEKTACKSGDRDKYDVDNMRTMKYSSRYQITFSLMNNNPQSVLLDWDIREAIKSYMYPLLNELSILNNFTVDSQIQNYASLSLKPTLRNRPGKPQYYSFDQEHLPHFVNSAEWNLASTISSHPTINFILYIPSDDQSPLWIHDSRGEPLLSNAFLIPRWGGVVIKNLPKDTLNQQHHRLSKDDLKPIMKLFSYQLRSLLGVHDHKSNSRAQASDFDVTSISASRSTISMLEKDTLIRQRTIENIVDAASTLNSLAQLVTEIPNMVVLDHISLQVQQSLQSLQLARQYLETGKYDLSLQHAIEAIELAEKAFFDPTMVSMLYFPDEHKYAIYMPLFVPISVPMFAVVGASPVRTKFGNRILRWYQDNNLHVIPVNPKETHIESIPAISSIDQLPEPAHTGLSIITPPSVTLKILQQAESLGIRNVWIQPGAEDQAVLDFIKQGHLENVIVGGPCLLVEGPCIVRSRSNL
ncbi:hypothetical protein EC973_008328 [Apophysomyces ossiformis]|uniref:CoA-binding domain-containing protein n=1 Tax=Apophysomyces ossiformis TaxID=679940 RepID=A0A8H7BVE1_9FUNG|nr:hypothetical protein EC973_008328 [Apophysomyces ossiformis]